MNISNKLTIARIFLTFIMMMCLFMKGFTFKLFALIVFILAAASDYLDGYFAKKRNEITNFGKFMDPIADKILTIAAFLAFVEMKLIPAWIVVIIIFRELLISGLRLAALSKGEVIAAEVGGKHKTVSQIVSIFTILVFIIIKEAGTRIFTFWNPNFEYWYKQGIFFLMIITALLTVISGASFIIRNRKHFLNG